MHRTVEASGWGFVMTLVMLAGATPGAADKATARTQATQGIELYRSGEFETALDKLQRAQSLYAAPVHMLYIGRCQRELGQWVEASETLRTLSRLVLAADAPVPFKNAVADGTRELAQLEARVPQLLLRVEPEEVADLTVTLDGQPLSSAVIGIKRPLNPGRHRLHASAEGYQDVERTFDVTEGQVEELSIRLEATVQEMEEAQAEPAADDLESERPGVQLVFGARLGAVLPRGEIPGAVVRPQFPRDPEFSEFAAAGGQLELHAGLRLWQHWSAGLYLELTALSPEPLQVFDNLDVTNESLSLVAVGVSASFGTPSGEFGAFAELGLGVQAMSHTYVFEPTRLTDCSGDVTSSGPALRLGAGLNLPLQDFFQLTPYANVSVAGFNSVEFVGDSCIPSMNEDPILTGSFDVSGGPTHFLIGLGVGGEFLVDTEW